MTDADWLEVRAIYKAGIATRHATFETAPPSWEQWDDSHLAEHRIVAVLDGAVVGWAALSPVSDRCADSGVAENSVYVDPAHQGRGIGQQLLGSLIASAEAAGIWTIQSGIFPENVASIALHRQYGFRVVGRRERFGQLDGMWRDTLLLERRSRTVGTNETGAGSSTTALPNGPMPPIISFVGPSGVGKTTLIESLIPILRATGCRVGTVKHASHGHDVDKVGSDSWRHRTAGAEAVLLAGMDGAVLFLAPASGQDHDRGRHHQPGPTDQLHGLAALVETHLTDVDIVLAEGYVPLHDALVAVQRTGVPPKPTGAQIAPWFIISDHPSDGDLHFDQLDEIARRLLARVLP